MSDNDLTPELCHDTWTVADSSGGRWWPNEESERLINESPFPEAKAISLCRDAGTGEWHN